MAELHVFEYGGTTFGTFRKTYGLNVEDFCAKTIRWGYDFLSNYNQNLKIDIFTPLQQIPCHCESRLGTLLLISWWRVTRIICSWR